MTRKIEEIEKYYDYICKQMRKAEKDNNQIEAEYCAMHALMVWESLGEVNVTNNDKFKLNKEEYENIVSLVEKHQKRYQKYRLLNLIKSFVGVVALFLMMVFVIKADTKLAAATSMGLLLWAVYQNGKKGQENYQQWQLNIIEKNVSKELIEYNSKFLKEV